MSYAIRRDGLGWRAVSGPDDCTSDEVWQSDTPAPSGAGLLLPLQGEARSALIESDITVIRCAEAGVSVPAAWRDYRAALRAIVSAQSVSEGTQLPPRPEYPPNT